MCGAFAHGAIFLVRDSGVGGSAIGFLVANRSAVVSLLSFVCLFLGFHTLGLYVHNDVMQALGSPEKQLALLPVFAEWLLLLHRVGYHLAGLLAYADTFNDDCMYGAVSGVRGCGLGGRVYLQLSLIAWHWVHLSTCRQLRLRLIFLAASLLGVDVSRGR